MMSLEEKRDALDLRKGKTDSFVGRLYGIKEFVP